MNLKDFAQINKANKQAYLRKKLQQQGLEGLAEELHVLPPRSLERLRDWVTEDPAMKRVKMMVKHLCHEDDPVLIMGESGTGKELIASALHGTRQGKFYAINTTSMPDELIESELFGHVKGSFTGAHVDRVGKFCEAKDGTIFLDEIGYMKPNMQVKLLRALQERVITPVGSNAEIQINCRVVAATRFRIREEFPPGIITWYKNFHEDLYWRIATHELFLTPLRERKGDILEILDAVLDPDHTLPEDYREWLQEQPLTGNFRELEALVKRKRLEIRIDNREKRGPTTLA